MIKGLRLLLCVVLLSGCCHCPEQMTIAPDWLQPGYWEKLRAETAMRERRGKSFELERPSDSGWYIGPREDGSVGPIKIEKED